MKIKVKFFDRNIVRNYSQVLTLISTIFSFAFIVITIPNCLKLYFGILLALIFVLIYIFMWVCSNNLKNVVLNINGSTVIIKTGDIFEEEALKVIAFNEYFDTIVDNKIIAENSLNGIFIKTKLRDLNELDSLINSDLTLKGKLLESNNTRPLGNKNKYPLGTIIQYDNYLLTAFTKFDNDNRAYLSMQDYVNFLLNFWNEVDIIYAGQSVSIPLLGSGITRFREIHSISEQDLLELLIWSFKVSRIKFPYPSKVSIIVHESKKEKINFYKLKN